MDDDFLKRFDNAKKILEGNGIVDCHFIRFKTLFKAVMSLKPDQDKDPNNLQVLHALCYDLVNIAVCNDKNLSMESQDYNLAYKMWNSHAASILSKLYKENCGSDVMENYLVLQKFYCDAEMMKAFATDDPLQIFPKKQKKEIDLPALLGFSESNLQEEHTIEPISVEEKPSDEENVVDDEVVLSPTADDGSEPHAPSKGNLIIIYIPRYWDESNLKSFFEPFGAVTNTRIIRNKEGISKGYGFVDFENPEHSVDAMQTLDGKNIEGKNLKIMIAGCGVKANLFVWNIPENWNELDLGKVFTRFGIVTDKRILRRNGKTRYCGFVRFVSEESARNAQKALNQKHITHKGKQVFLQVQPAKKNIKKQKMDAARKKLPGMIPNNHMAKLMFQQHQLTMEIMSKQKHRGGARPVERPSSIPIQSQVSMNAAAFAERQRIKHSMPISMYEPEEQRYEDKSIPVIPGRSRKYNTKQLQTDGPSKIATFGTTTLKDKYTDSDFFSFLK